MLTRQRAKASTPILLSADRTASPCPPHLPSQGHTGRCSLQSPEILGKFLSSRKDQGNKERPPPGSSGLESRKEGKNLMDAAKGLVLLGRMNTETATCMATLRSSGQLFHV